MKNLWLNSMRKNVTPICFLLFLLAGFPVVATEIEAIELSGEEIQQAFSDVRDNAEVQDAAKTRASNDWYADGRFINRWDNGTNSGVVTGTWRIKGNQRCVTVTIGLPGRVGKESCGVISRRGDKYLSYNPDGSIHGIHTLSPLP